ncbi:MAG: hypothetical protein H7338_10115 [Candidatus Sericytochromatia bacterium]|nr:hypothetical protein [Candidatus Sericytochromatia bacterium]
MKDLTVGQKTAEPAFETLTLPVPPLIPVKSSPVGGAVSGLGQDARTAKGGPAAGFAPADAVTRFAGRPPAGPAPGTLEAALLQDMTEAPGLPPQWREAFLQLPPAAQQAMARMYRQLAPQGQSSFLCYPPNERAAMSQLFSRMRPTQQSAFVRITPGQQRTMAQMTVGMTGPAQAAFLARPAAEQTLMAQTFRTLDAPTQAAFVTVHPDQQVQFAQVWAAAGRVELGHSRAPSQGTASQSPLEAPTSKMGDSTELANQTRLSQLLVSGRLTQPGRSGQTALGALDSLRIVSLALPPGSNDPMYRQQLFNTLVTELAAPTGIRQDNYNTCGATIAQRMFARENPGDYARLVIGLASEEGRATLPNGAVVSRAPNSLVAQTPDWADDKSRDNRNQVERLVQAAFMTFASPTHYSNAKDSNTILGIGIASGMSGGGIADLTSAIRGRDVAVLPSDNFVTVLDGGNMTGVSKSTLMQGLETQMQRHPKEAVAVELNFNTRGNSSSADLHWVEIHTLTDNRVHYLNPHGNSFRLPTGKGLADLPVDAETGKHYTEADGKDNTPPRRIYEDGAESVERQWFEHSVEEVMVDPDIQGRMKGSEPARFNPL